MLKSGEWYLLAGSGARPRIYRLSKMRDVAVLDDTFERPSGSVLPRVWRATVERFEAGLRRASATLRVGPGALALLERLPADIVEPLSAAVPDAHGRRTAVVPIESIAFAAAQLLMMGDGVEVLEPVALRDEIVSRASGVLALYGAPGEPSTKRTTRVAAPASRRASPQAPTKS